MSMSLERRVKTEPALPEEQDDLLLYYLNTDYLSAETPWSLDSALPLSPPYTDKRDHGSQDGWLLNTLPSGAPSDGAYVRAPPFHGTSCPSPQVITLEACQKTTSESLALNRPSPSPGSSSCSSCSSTLADHEQRKRKRARKRREASEQALSMPRSPAVLMPLLPAAHPVKHEVVTLEMATRSDRVESVSELQKAAAHAKRQERLIKNRAAAILSRKRKREHLTTLEEQKERLVSENALLKTRLAALEGKVESLRHENEHLKSRPISDDDGCSTQKQK